MSEENKTPDAIATQAQTASTNSDWFLQSLVSMVNGTSTEMGITLQVGGLLVSGRLVSGDLYFSAFGETFAGALKDTEEAPKVRAMFEKYGEIYKATDDTRSGEPPQYIHLKDARFFGINENPVPSTGVWWRGRISEVEGFVLGVFSADNSN